MWWHRINPFNGCRFPCDCVAIPRQEGGPGPVGIVALGARHKRYRGRAEGWLVVASLEPA